MILISPFAKMMRNNERHPKNYPHWDQVIAGIREPIVQVGVRGETPLVSDFRPNLSFDQLATLVKQSRTWISVDSFFQHFCWDLGKPGVVIFGQSDPVIFGHPENTNLLKDRRYLRDKQFWLWEQAAYRDDCWVEPEAVLEAIAKFR